MGKAKILGLGLLMAVVAFGVFCASIITLYSAAKFCDQPANFKEFDVPGEIMSPVYRGGEIYQTNHFLKDGREYESRSFDQYRWWCIRPGVFEVNDIVAFKDSASGDVIIAKIKEVHGNTYTVLSEAGELVIQHNQIVARD